MKYMFSFWGYRPSFFKETDLIFSFLIEGGHKVFSPLPLVAPKTVFLWNFALN